MLVKIIVTQDDGTVTETSVGLSKVDQEVLEITSDPSLDTPALWVRDILEFWLENNKEDV
jgi:hypothetical protein